jgi:hypothetical protein
VPSSRHASKPLDSHRVRRNSGTANQNIVLITKPPPRLVGFTPNTLQMQGSGSLCV